jgi:hypothetical protein
VTAWSYRYGVRLVLWSLHPPTFTILDPDTRETTELRLTGPPDPDVRRAATRQLMATVQVYVPASLAAAIDLETFGLRAQQLGGAEISKVRRGDHFGSFRVTCDAAAARMLVRELEAIVPPTELLERDRAATLAGIAREVNQAPATGQP